MDLLQTLYAIQHLAQLFGKPLEMSREQFNSLATITQLEIFREYADGYATGSGAEVDARVSAMLAPFKEMQSFTSSTWAVNTSLGYGVSALKFVLASRTHTPLDAWAYDNSLDYPDKVTKIDIVTTSEANERLSNSLTYPSDSSPILYFDKTGGASQYACYVIPDTFSAIRVYSLCYPLDPVLSTTITNGVVAIVSGTSTPLTIPAEFHIDFIRRMLEHLGISAGNQIISQYVDKQKIAER